MAQTAWDDLTNIVFAWSSSCDWSSILVSVKRWTNAARFHTFPGCSAHWSFFNWASVSTLKIICWHPYTPILDFQCLLLAFGCGKYHSSSLSSSKSSSSTSIVLAFVHEVPWQWPQASEHFRPFLRQVHLAELHSLSQSHQMIFSSSAGAGGRSIRMGE